MKENQNPYWPRGLSRVRAAGYTGFSLPLWDRMVEAGEMPKPKRVHGRTIWDRVAVDRALDVWFGNVSQSGEQVIEFDAGSTTKRLSIEERRSLPNWGLSETEPTTWLTEEEAAIWMEEYRDQRKEASSKRPMSRLQRIALAGTKVKIRPFK
jgi:predicted DNA-binding transcriptional regulator AlpA